MKMRGARIFLEALRCEGIDAVFGYPGGAVLHIYDEIARSGEQLGIKHYLVRHEQAAHLAEPQREQIRRNDLGEMALGRRHADLGARAGVENRVGLAGHRRVDHVDDRENLRLVRRGLGEPARLHGVEGLARLTDADHERPGVEDGVAVAELARDVDLDRQASPVLDGVLGHEARVVAGAAAHDEDLVDVAQVLVGEAVELVEPEPAVRGGAPTQGLRDRGGLLVDLLQHEILEAALLGGLEVPGDLPGLQRHLRAVEIRRADLARTDGHHHVVVHDVDLPGVREERRDVGGDEARPVRPP
ncbi:MAG: hypothetical protein C4321_08940, partial [Chloroflexota bacterium]